MIVIEIVTRLAFAIASLALMALAGGLIVYGAGGVLDAYGAPEADVGPVLLDAVGYTIIAIAVFDVGKYLLEEEAIRGREMRQAAEARRSLTKFVSTIAIAVFLESLVSVFRASKSDVQTMIYPTFLLLAGVALVIGLGVYQKLSAQVEQRVAERDRSSDENEARADEVPKG